MDATAWLSTLGGGHSALGEHSLGHVSLVNIAESKFGFVYGVVYSLFLYLHKQTTSMYLTVCVY